MILDIGKRIRELRTLKSLTLEELADRCELTKGFLSQLENDMNTPSIQTLMDITEVLGISMSDFFKEEPYEKIVFKQADLFDDEKDDYLRQWLVPNAQSNDMEPIRLVLKSGGIGPKVCAAHGEEFGYVIKGSGVLVFEDGRKYILQKQNSFYLVDAKAHWIENHNKSDLEVIWVSTPPIF